LFCEACTSRSAKNFLQDKKGWLALMFLRGYLPVGALAFLLCWLGCIPALAQLRVVSYNTTGGPRAGLDTVLAAISSDAANGFAKPPDVFALQEQSASASTTQGIVDLLNGMFGAGTYARATLDGATSGAGRPGLIYNTTTVQLIDQIAFGTVNTSAQARQTMRYQLQLVGYDSAAEFYVYSNHYKASTGSSDQARRNLEATALRSNLDGLGEGTHAILAGDYNIRSSSEASYQTLLAAGPGQAFDPIDQPGSWHDNASFKSIHTQAPSDNPGSGLVGGGVDDRFDFQLVTGELLDSEGLSYIPGSYRVLGNNGTHQCCSHSITTGTGAAPNVLAALTTASDHLPVIADYQLPAVMDVFAATLPATLSLGQSFDWEIAVENVADVLAEIGADELDYMATLSGDLTGSFVGIDEPLNGGNLHLLSLDTSSLGVRSGLLTIESSSQAVANGFIQLPFSYTVVSVPEPSLGVFSIGIALIPIGTRKRRDNLALS
jgi:endonuclease/exonuclease/phosphatase family metal-dependent hydrolase